MELNKKQIIETIESRIDALAIMHHEIDWWDAMDDNSPEYEYMWAACKALNELKELYEETLIDVKDSK